MADTLTTVLVSALTSGVVAVGIELIAKPRLEARKEVILAAHRQRRAFADLLVRILMITGKWTDYQRPEGLSRGAAQRFQAEMARGADELDESTRTMSDDLSIVALTYPANRDRTLIGRYIFTARGIQLSDRTFNEKAELLTALTTSIHEWLFGRMWRPMSREEARNNLVRTLDQIAPTEDGG